MEAYVENDKKDDVKAVENDKDPEQPPSCSSWEQQGEAASRMIQQEFQFFPNPTFEWYKL